MKAVLFDLDETLLDRTESLKDFTHWQAKGMLRNSISNPSEFSDRFLELDSNGSVWKDKVYSHLIKEFQITGWSITELLLSYELCFSGFCKPKSGSIEALKYIHSTGFKFGLVSNGKSPFQERNFNALGVSDLFTTVIVSGAVGCRKPEREIFEMACNALNILPTEAVFVGDNPKADMDGAKDVGMYTIYVPGHYGKNYENSDAVCNDFFELTSILEDAF